MSGFFSRLFGKTDANYGLRVGTLHSIVSDDKSGNLGVVKILVLEPQAVHIRLYQNKHAARPVTLNPSELSLGKPPWGSFENDGTADDQSAEQGFGIGHLPISLKDFIYAWQPTFIMDSPVTEDELEGYNHWKEYGDGVFGSV